MKNSYTKHISFLLMLLKLSTCFSFNHSFKLKDGIFKKHKFNFTVCKVIDGRLNKERPIGHFCKDFSTIKEYIGNDSLAEDLNAFFKQNHSSFDTSNKIILVINQINVKELKNSKRDAYEFTLSFDYYKIAANEAKLYYQQFYTYNERVKMSKQRAINRVFSNAMLSAFTDLKYRLTLYKECSLIVIDTSDLYNSAKKKPKRVLSSQNIKDGLYFSGKDLYLNKIVSYTSYTLPDTIDMQRHPSILKLKNCSIDKAYAVVIYGRIFVFITDGYYKEVFFNTEEKLYFKITRYVVSNAAQIGSAAVGVAGAFLPSSVPRAVATSITQKIIENSVTTKTNTNYIIDFETGTWTLD